MKNTAITPLKLTNLEKNFNWSYFTSSITSMKNFIKIKAFKESKIVFEFDIALTAISNYIF